MATDAEYRQRVSQFGWPELDSLWQQILARDTPEWDDGKAFEFLTLRAFQLDGAEVRWPFRVRLFGEEVEQVDGAVLSRGLHCLVEAKDSAEKVSVAPVAKMRNQLLRRPAGTFGVVFSSSDFTGPAAMMTHFTHPQTILLWRGSELTFALGRRQFVANLERKYRVAVLTGQPDFNILDEDIE